MQSFFKIDAGWNRCSIALIVAIALSSHPGKVYAQAISADNAGNTLNTSRDVGILSDRQTFTDSVNSTDTDDYYKFAFSSTGNISLFVNGLAAGTKLELLDSSGSKLQSSTNSGTTWNVTNVSSG